jgi:hypothetical protein
MYGLSHWLFKLLALSYPSTLASSHAQSPQTQAAQDASKIEQQQDVVKWDEHSVLIHGRRVMLFSGEFHPFRLPSPELWLDVFQKISSMSYTAVSFYLDWALLEGDRGRNGSATCLPRRVLIFVVKDRHCRSPSHSYK